VGYGLENTTIVFRSIRSWGWTSSATQGNFHVDGLINDRGNLLALLVKDNARVEVEKKKEKI